MDYLCEIMRWIGLSSEQERRERDIGPIAHPSYYSLTASVARSRAPLRFDQLFWRLFSTSAGSLRARFTR